MALSLGTSQLAAIVGHALAAYPEECCGLLLGDGGLQDARVGAVLPVENRHAQPRRGFELAVDAIACALAQERRGGRAVLGVYHSHPDGTPVPSVRDEREAWAGWSYLIVPVIDGACGEPRCFRRDGTGAPLAEEPIEVA